KVARYGPKRRIDRRTLSTKLPWNPSHAPPKAKARKHHASGPFLLRQQLAVVVHLELQRSRAQAGRHDLVIHLVADVGINQVVGEHATLGEELIVILQGLQRAFQGGRRLRDALRLLWRQLVEVLIHRLVRLDAVLDAIQAGQHHRGKAQVRVAARVRRTELNALRLRVRARDRDTHRSGTVALRVHQVNRRLEARHQAVVGVQRRVGKRQHRASVLQYAADVVAVGIGKTRVTILVVEQRLAVLPQGLVRVHTRTVIAGQRLRHEGRGLPIPPRHVADDVLESLDVIRRSQQRVELVVDLLLPAGAHLVVQTLQGEARLHELLAHLIAQVLVAVVRRDREVATLRAGLVAQVAGTIQVELLVAVPPTGIGIHAVESLVALHAVAHGVE